MATGPSSIQDAHYRRGVVLGLTIGEAILLLLFCLLLVLAVPLIDKTQEIDRVKRILSTREAEVAERERELLKLREKVVTVESAAGRRIEDLTREYVAEQKRSADAFGLLLTTIGSDQKVRDRGQEMETASTFAEQIRGFKDIQEVVSDALGHDVGSDSRHIIEAIRATANEAKRARLSDLDKQSIVERAISAEARERETKREFDNTKGQLENLKRQVAEGGRGVDAVPCWSTDSGRPEYIFDVALTTRGLILRDRKLLHRKQDQAKLPIGDIPFGSEIAPQRFLVVTRRLFDWSVQHECRFFVRAFDKTSETEKAIFKRHLRFLETHFYKYEELNEQF
jgi:hypothetical protein